MTLLLHWCGTVLLHTFGFLVTRQVHQQDTAQYIIFEIKINTSFNSSFPGKLPMLFMAMTCNFGKRLMPLTIHHNSRNKSWTFWSSPPLAGSPHTTMDPSIRMAAKAEVVATKDSTLCKRHWTFEASPPKSGSPHETTPPSSQMAAKARKVAWICWTFWSFSCTARLSPPASWFPHVTTVRSDLIAANAPDAVAWICCTCFNWSTTSPQMATNEPKNAPNLLQPLIVSWVHDVFQPLIPTKSTSHLVEVIISAPQWCDLTPSCWCSHQTLDHPMLQQIHPVSVQQRRLR